MFTIAYVLGSRPDASRLSRRAWNNPSSALASCWATPMSTSLVALETGMDFLRSSFSFRRDQWAQSRARNGGADLRSPYRTGAQAFSWGVVESATSLSSREVSARSGAPYRIRVSPIGADSG